METERKVESIMQELKRLTSENQQLSAGLSSINDVTNSIKSLGIQQSC